MKFSLIFTVFNEEESISYFLESLLKQSVLPDEIVIVDGGSTDSTVKIIYDKLQTINTLKLIVDETCNKKHSKGPIARGRNVAIEATTSDVILVTDAGCELESDWCKSMMNSFKQGADIVAGIYSARVKNQFQSYLADVFCPDFKQFDNPKSFLPSSRSLGFKKELWRKVGGYPENSYTAEDTKFILNLYEETERVVIEHNALVYWDLPKDPQELFKKVEAYGEGDGLQRLDFFKYLARFAILLTIPVSILALLITKKKMIAIPMYYFMIKGYLKGTFKGCF
ncbi:glycosyltransferase [Photobacterium sp. CAU 1568]|uniref:Glycosyltransferase n=1 Tax=Photobacterium arenosum TaxID=2774143 RepID=A0ABR9BI50_9GAMM|nr:glycosyltransferase [Photobacterium arenosum]MBD8512230.1 glycosyltransferase [Photobacterium arenosum]